MFAIVIVCVTLGLVAGQSAEVAFSAGLTHNQQITNNDTVRFDKVFTNNGNGYDPSSGNFTCPTAGYYVFQFHALAETDASSWLELYKNDNYIASIFGHTATDYAGSGNTVILQMAQGDVVNVRAVDQSYGYLTNLYGVTDEIYGTFSGYMVSAA